jgi:glycosyltransferase involved in cell wall biosynthesis
MKVVYFIDHLRPDGTQQVLRQLVVGLSTRGYQQTIVCINDSWDAQVVQDLRDGGADVRIVGKAALATGFGFLATWFWLRREQFQVAITFLFFADVFGRVLAHAAKVPRIISSLRARNIHYTSWQRFLVRQTMRCVDTVVLNSAATRGFAIAEEGARPEQIIIIPNGVNIDYSPNMIDRAAVWAEFGLPDDSRLIGSIGRLTYQKGFDLLIAALGKIPDQHINLLIIGSGDDELHLKAYAMELGVDDRVHFAGYRRDVLRLLRALDLYVHPARFEGMPNALLEAMAAGCPTIASAVDGNRELIEDGVNGWLTPVEDVSALAKTINSALNDRDEMRKRAAAAQQFIVSQFSVEAMVVRWDQVLDNVYPQDLVIC